MEKKKNRIDQEVTPSTVKALLDDGYRVEVERSVDRCYRDDEFEAVGATLVPEGSWETAPKEYIVIGLKELPESDSPFPPHLCLLDCVGSANVSQLPSPIPISNSATATKASKAGRSIYPASSAGTDYSTISNSSRTRTVAGLLRSDITPAMRVLLSPC